MSIIFIFLIYPLIVNLTFEMFNCIKVEDQYYLKRDLDIECWSKRHSIQIFTIAIPIIAVWVLGFPLMILLILQRKRSQLGKKDILIKYGLFYIGLTDSGFYWEVIIINLRKIIFIALSVSLSK